MNVDNHACSSLVICFPKGEQFVDRPAFTTASLQLGIPASNRGPRNSPIYPRKTGVAAVRTAFPFDWSRISMGADRSGHTPDVRYDVHSSPAVERNRQVGVHLKCPRVNGKVSRRIVEPTASASHSGHCGSNIRANIDRFRSGGDRNCQPRSSPILRVDSDRGSSQSLRQSTTDRRG